MSDLNFRTIKFHHNVYRLSRVDLTRSDVSLFHWMLSDKLHKKAFPIRSKSKQKMSRTRTQKILFKMKQIHIWQKKWKYGTQNKRQLGIYSFRVISIFLVFSTLSGTRSAEMETWTINRQSVQSLFTVSKST